MKNSKKIITIVALTLLVTLGCDQDLQVVNPNEPTPEVLTSEEGLKRQASGVYNAMGQGWFEWIVWFYHESMGDAFGVPWSNYNWRTMNHPTTVTFSDGTIHRPIDTNRGLTQSEEADLLNSREEAFPPFLYEWRQMYRINNEANLILQILDEGNIVFSGDGATKQQGYAAWAYFWKGFAMSRVGSMYEQGLIVDTYGVTNNDYKTRQEIIAESNRLLDLAISNSPGFDAVSDVVPSQFGAMTSASLAQSARTLKARNLLVNKYRTDITNAEWQEIADLTSTGLQVNTNALSLVADNATYLGSVSPTYRFWLGWAFVSDRLIQEFYPGDNRLTSFSVSLANDPPTTTADTAFQYTGARGWHFISPYLVDPPYYGEANIGDMTLYLISAEENVLMNAEANFALGNLNEAATGVNTSRTLQSAGLAAEDATSITWEKIRRERRVALAGTRGALSFYDARRLGWVRDVSEGGGRSNAWVRPKDANGNILPIDKGAVINYNYLEYWEAPIHELTFNPVDGDEAPNQ
ncbi:MAG: hypothetical protein BalsKO_00900 [Balneolaceae bacterium]